MTNQATVLTDLSISDWLDRYHAAIENVESEHAKAITAPRHLRVLHEVNVRHYLKQMKQARQALSKYIREGEDINEFEQPEEYDDRLRRSCELGDLFHSENAPDLYRDTTAILDDLFDTVFHGVWDEPSIRIAREQRWMDYLVYDATYSYWGENWREEYDLCFSLRELAASLTTGEAA